MSGRRATRLVMVVGAEVGDASDPGPTTRAHALASALPDARLVSHDEAVGDADAAVVVVAPPSSDLSSIAATGARLIVDLAYARPYAMRAAAGGRLRVALATDRLTHALRSADHLITATEAQRDLWIGALVSERLVHQDRYAADSTLRSFIETVPTPPAAGPGSTGIRDGGEPKTVLWNGPRHHWLDWDTAASAVDRVEHAQLVEMPNDRWLNQAERAALVASAVCVLRLHRGDLAARYSASQRLIDCVSWGTPMIATDGDQTARRVATLGLGYVVPPRDPDAVARAIAAIVARPIDGRPWFARSHESAQHGLDALVRLIDGPRLRLPFASRAARRAGERLRAPFRRFD